MSGDSPKSDVIRLLTVSVGSVWRGNPEFLEYAGTEQVVLYADRGWCLVIENGSRFSSCVTRFRYLNFLAVFEPTPNSKISKDTILARYRKIKFHVVRGEKVPYVR